MANTVPVGFEEARVKAIELEYQAWVQWMRANFKFKQAMAMCRFLGRVGAGHGFWLHMRKYQS